MLDKIVVYMEQEDTTIFQQDESIEGAEDTQEEISII